MPHKHDHTPGPWTVSGLLDSKKYLECEAVVADGPMAVASVHVPHSHPNISNTLERCRANARLIAAAPDLLEACTEARRYFLNRPGNSEVQLCERLGKAIAWATHEKAKKDEEG